MCLAKDAEVFLVYAQEKSRTQAFIVPADTAGVPSGRAYCSDGRTTLPVYTVHFNGVVVPRPTD